MAKDPKTENTQEITKESEAVYTMDELISAAEAAFGVKPEVVIAAFRKAGISKATKSEAEAAIKAFMEMEVK